MYPPFTKITQTLSFHPASLEQFLRAIWNAVFWAVVLILPHMKLNLQISCCAFLDGGVWWAAVHGVAKSWTRLSNFTLTFHFYALEKEMATHSSILAWRIPGTGEPGGLPSMGSHRVRHDWSDLAAAAAAYLFWYLMGCLQQKNWKTTH